MPRAPWIALTIGSLAAIAALVAPASIAPGIRPIAGLLMLTCGCVVLARPLAAPLARLARLTHLASTCRLVGLLLLAASLATGLVLGPASPATILALVLALPGVSLLALGSTTAPPTRLGLTADQADAPAAGHVDAPRPDHARAA